MIPYGWVFIAFFAGLIVGVGGVLLLGIYLEARERRNDPWRQP